MTTLELALFILALLVLFVMSFIPGYDFGGVEDTDDGHAFSGDDIE